MFGQQAIPAPQWRVDRRRQFPRRPGGHAVQADLATGNQPVGAGVLQANQHALGRRVGFERQPGRARLGDGRLHDEQFVAARQAQADDVARPHAGLDQVVRGQVGAAPEFVISEGLIQPVDGNGGGMPQDRGFQDIGQRFRLQQIRPTGALENHRYGDNPANGMFAY